MSPAAFVSQTEWVELRRVMRKWSRASAFREMEVAQGRLDALLELGFADDHPAVRQLVAAIESCRRRMARANRARFSSEWFMCRPGLRADDVLAGDRGFCGQFLVALLSLRASHDLTPASDGRTS